MKKSKKKSSVEVEPARTKVVEALEQLKTLNDPHTEFWDEYQKRQDQVVLGLEAVKANEMTDK